MRQLTEVEHNRLLLIEQAYQKLRAERRHYMTLRRWTKTLLLNLGHGEEQAERILTEVEQRTTTDAPYLLRKPENADEGSIH